MAVTKPLGQRSAHQQVNRHSFGRQLRIPCHTDNNRKIRHCPPAHSPT